MIESWAVHDVKGREITEWRIGSSNTPGPLTAKSKEGE